MFDPMSSAGHVLCVVAHPDDESFGLGALVSGLVDGGTRVSVLCFTHGEASTLGAEESRLSYLRPRELARAGEVLGVEHITLLDYPDGDLASIPLERLAQDVKAKIGGADAMLVFDIGGITGHPDHRAATRAALEAAGDLGVRVFAWSITDEVASTLGAEFGAGFVGRALSGSGSEIEVDRTRQVEAIRCHHSQSNSNPVVWRRLELQGNKEWVVLLMGSDERTVPEGDRAEEPRVRGW